MYVVDWRFVEGVATASGPINGKATVNNTGEFRRKTMIWKAEYISVLRAAVRLRFVHFLAWKLEQIDQCESNLYEYVPHMIA